MWVKEESRMILRFLVWMTERVVRQPAEIENTGTGEGLGDNESNFR